MRLISHFLVFLLLFILVLGKATAGNRSLPYDDSWLFKRYTPFSKDIDTQKEDCEVDEYDYEEAEVISIGEDEEEMITVICDDTGGEYSCYELE